MNYLNWELSVLSKAVAYTNLSAAATNVGISQPQLSRIVSRLESTYGIRLLDREARRKSAWTPAAYRLIEIYQQAFRTFSGELQRIAEGGELQSLRIGTLEGLVPLSVQFCRHLLKLKATRVIDLQVLDLNELEELFLKRSLHVAFTSREPGRKKFSHSIRLGYQTLDEIRSDSGVQVLSSFEYGARGIPRGPLLESIPETGQVIVSNSLAARKLWLSRYGGHGVIPSEPRKSREAARAVPHVVHSEEVPVLLLGAEDLPQKFWEKAAAFKFSTQGSAPAHSPAAGANSSILISV